MTTLESQSKLIASVRDVRLRVLGEARARAVSASDHDWDVPTAGVLPRRGGLALRIHMIVALLAMLSGLVVLCLMLMLRTPATVCLDVSWVTAAGLVAVVALIAAVVVVAFAAARAD